MEPETGHGLQNLFLVEWENNVVKGNDIYFRWFNHLNPDVIKSKWTEQED